ncbi:MAG: PepSY-associated TM helix domain-containing protein [Gemmatimonadaceae bacterium]
MHVPFWRKWHRWIGLVGALFLAWAGVTGVIVGFTEFFGEDEEKREALRAVVSPVTTQGSSQQYVGPLTKAFATMAAKAPGAPIDKLLFEFKGDQPTITFYTGKPTGGEDKRYVVQAMTGELLKVDAYVDKPFLTRLHSGEAFGDGGLVVSMLWGVALAIMTFSGFLIYWHMHQRMDARHVKGWRRFFW